MKVKKNDNVVVLTGKDKGKTGTVIAVMPKDNKVVVEGVNVQFKSKKARSAQESSQIIKREGAIDASNVLVICAACGKATRVAHAEVDGKKVRT
ncbi:MAG: 50S ribosomal protein L24, partial [Clostridia bacterium]|nr:50S ribosomal protein L24 [Clostridia bacterium]